MVERLGIEPSGTKGPTDLQSAPAPYRTTAPVRARGGIGRSGAAGPESNRQPRSYGLRALPFELQQRLGFVFA